LSRHRDVPGDSIELATELRRVLSGKKGTNIDDEPVESLRHGLQDG
jgi:hypothetical protein